MLSITKLSARFNICSEGDVWLNGLLPCLSVLKKARGNQCYKGNLICTVQQYKSLS